MSFFPENIRKIYKSPSENQIAAPPSRPPLRKNIAGKISRIIRNPTTTAAKSSFRNLKVASSAIPSTARRSASGSTIIFTSMMLIHSMIPIIANALPTRMITRNIRSRSS